MTLVIPQRLTRTPVRHPDLLRRNAVAGQRDILKLRKQDRQAVHILQTRASMRAMDNPT